MVPRVRITYCSSFRMRSRIQHNDTIVRSLFTTEVDFAAARTGDRQNVRASAR
jgi:hypothetical protein